MSLFILNEESHSAAAEVVGSTPTRSIIIILVNYGIELSSILIIVGRNVVGYTNYNLSSVKYSVLTIDIEYGSSVIT
jgi:uncharacterized protein (DUF486 family)